MMKFAAVCPDIACQACVDAISRSLTRLSGVASVTVDVTAKQVTVEYDESETGPEAVRARLSAAGFEPV